FSAPDKDDAIGQPPFLKDPVNGGKAIGPGQGYVVRKAGWSRSRTSFTPVNGEEIRSFSGLFHQIGQFFPFLRFTDGRLYADGQAGLLCDGLDEGQEFRDIVEGLVGRGGEDVLSQFDPTDLSKFLGDLGTWEHPALSRFGPL